MRVCLIWKLESPNTCRHGMNLKMGSLSQVLCSKAAAETRASVTASCTESSLPNHSIIVSLSSNPKLFRSEILENGIWISVALPKNFTLETNISVWIISRFALFFPVQAQTVRFAAFAVPEQGSSTSVWSWVTNRTKFQKGKSNHLQSDKWFFAIDFGHTTLYRLLLQTQIALLGCVMDSLV